MKPAATIILTALVLALLLPSASNQSVGGSGREPISFSIEEARDDTTYSLGIVPPGKRLVLTDFHFFGQRLTLFADDDTAAVIRARAWGLKSGIVLRSGQELKLNSFSGNSGNPYPVTASGYYEPQTQGERIPISIYVDLGLKNDIQVVGTIPTGRSLTITDCFWYSSDSFGDLKFYVDGAFSAVLWNLPAETIAMTTGLVLPGGQQLALQETGQFPTNEAGEVTLCGFLVRD